MLIALLVLAFRVVLGDQRIPVTLAVLDQMVGDFPDGRLLFLVALSALGDQGVGDDFLQRLTILTALALVQQTVHVVGGETLIGEDGINVHVVVLGGVVFFGQNGGGQSE